MRFGERLIRLRKEKKISQEQLAEDLGVTRQTISNWENYKNYPDIAMLTMISDKYKISLDDLLKKDVDYVKKIDKQIKWGKKNKIILTLVIILIIIASIVSYFLYKRHCYMVTYTNTTYEIKEYDNSENHTTPTIYGKKNDKVKYYKFEDLNIPLNANYKIEENKSESSKYIIGQDVEEIWSVQFHENDEKYIDVFENSLDYCEDNDELFHSIFGPDFVVNPITAAMLLYGNTDKYLYETNIFTPALEMKKISFLKDYLMFLQPEFEWNEEQQMEKGTIILNLADGPYIANLVPHEDEDMNYVVLYVAYNNKLYEITYNNYSYEEVLELIKDIYFE